MKNPLICTLIALLLGFPLVACSEAVKPAPVVENTTKNQPKEAPKPDTESSKKEGLTDAKSETIELAKDMPKETSKEKPEPAAIIKAPEGVSAWNFSKTKVEDTPWKFPGNKFVNTPHGTIYRQTIKVENGPIAKKLNFTAKQKQKISVIIKAFEKKGGTAGEVKLSTVQLFWANAADVKAAENKWPFSKDRVINLKLVKEGMNLWQAEIYRKNWKGKINSLFVKPVLESYPDGNLPEGVEIEFLVERVGIE